jgi:recombination protein RecA
MAKGKKNTEEKVAAPAQQDDADAFSKDLIKEINKSFGSNEMMDFSDNKFEEAKRYIPSGCTALDYLMSNRRDGGYPEGRIIEIYGPPSIGKSLLGYQAIRSAQRMGGIGILIDTEYATFAPYLEELGVNTKKQFGFSSQKQVEKIFSLIDQTIVKAATNENFKGPIVIVWDSVAASASKKELEGDYEQITIGELARALSKGLKRIVDVVGKHNITLILLNQTRTKIGVMYGDPEDSCGGNALKFFASIRVKLSGGRGIFEDEAKKDVRIGNGVIATTVKNKMAPPGRRCEFDLIFGQGSYENDQLFDAMREAGTVIVGDRKVLLEGTGAWKTITLSDVKTGEILKEEKFYKADFTDKILNNPEYREFNFALMDKAFIFHFKKDNETNE